MLTLEKPVYFSDGWHAAKKTYAIYNPVTGEKLAEVADCGAEEARRAAEVAMTAFDTWRFTTAFERAAILERWYDLIMKNQEALARTMTEEMGKPVRESRGEIVYAAGFVKWYAEEAKRLYGEIVPSQAAHKRLLAVKQPVGPTFAITPWNFPAGMVTRKAAPALAAGCTFILKPAEQTPLTALHLASLWEEAGGPVGTLQVLPAADPVPLSNALLEDERIRKITFTGSTEVGKLLYEKAAKTVKRISLELGGHAPFIVFADADLPSVVREVMVSKFRNTGQTCVCANRIYVQAPVVEEFTRLYAEEVKKLQVGNPLEDETAVGPLVDKQGLEKVKRHVEDAVAKGAKVITGGNALEGLFFEPTVLTNVSNDMLITQEETFGPVAPIISFEGDDEAIFAANNTSFGLAAYLYTRDLSRAFRVAERLEYGIIGVNDGLPSTPQAPFGGMKSSGIGREGGKWGIEEYLEVKFISIGLG